MKGLEGEVEVEEVTARRALLREVTWRGHEVTPAMRKGTLSEGGSKGTIKNTHTHTLVMVRATGSHT